MRHVSLLCLWLLHRHNAEGASKSTNEHGAHKKGRTNEHNSKELPHVTLKSKEGKPLHVTLSSKERAQQRHDNIVARNQAAQRAEDAEWDPLRRQRAARQRLRHHHAAFVPPSRDAAPLCGSDKFPMRVRSYSQSNAVWKSSSELGYVIFHNIEQTRLRGHLRVGGVQTPRHRAHAVTGTTSRRRRGAPEV